MEEQDCFPDRDGCPQPIVVQGKSREYLSIPELRFLGTTITDLLH